MADEDHMEDRVNRCNVEPVLESLEPRLLLSGSVVISEFMASNSSGILDGDGASPDGWVGCRPTGDLQPPDIAAALLVLTHGQWSRCVTSLDDSAGEFVGLVVGADHGPSTASDGQNKLSLAPGSGAAKAPVGTTSAHDSGTVKGSVKAIDDGSLDARRCCGHVSIPG